MSKELNYEFFEYISDYPDKDKFRFIIKLGNYISHEVVGKKANAENLDNMDRIACAELFLNKYKGYFMRYNKSVYDIYMNAKLYDKFKKDIALYIDLRIPYFYYIKDKKIPNSDGYKYYKGIEMLEGKINYQFKESMTLEKKLFKVKKEIKGLLLPTDKQITYLNYLAKEAGYEVINETEITKEIAGKLIGFLKDDINLEIELQNKFLIYE